MVQRAKFSSQRYGAYTYVRRTLLSVLLFSCVHEVTFALEYFCAEDEQTYKYDIITQAEAKLMAQKFNSYKPPVKIDFLKLSYIRMTDRQGLTFAVL